MTRDELPSEIQSLIAQCEANVNKFTNDQMSAALYFAETMASQFDIDTQCKIAFAEMMLIRWDRTEHDSRLFEKCVTDMRDGIRTPELLADMQRVTRELRGGE